MSDAAELARLTAAIVAEIRRHSLEARRHSIAAAELGNQDYDEEADLHEADARRHTETAERLHAILHPKEPAK